ncbi:MAG: CAP-associated domain-containing protein, partial [Bacilli bacterium]
MRKLFILLLLLSIGVYVVPKFSFEQLKMKIEQFLPNEKSAFTKVGQPFSLKSSVPNIAINRELSLYQIPIGSTVEEVTQVLGEANRIDPSGLGFEWWIYNDSFTDYIQLGMKDGRVNVIYSNGSDVSVGGLVLGDSYTTLAEQYSFVQQFEVQFDKATFTIEQTEIDVSHHPIIMEGNVGIQFFI